MTRAIEGRTASDIAASIRDLFDRGALAPGDPLPIARELAEQLGVNRNTVTAAYRLLAQAGITVTRGRGGTSVAQPTALAHEGRTPDTVLRDVGNGNPDPLLLPDIHAALTTLPANPVLYGEPVIDPQVAEWATQRLAEDQPREFGLHITAGAVDAVERLLAQALGPGDAVALEDPCFLTSVHTVRQAGYRTVPVPVDEQGMTPDGLRAALEAGVRAVVITPRAHNPTGVSLTASRAAELRDMLADHPYVLVIEDDHFSLLSTADYQTIIGAGQQRWALVRSVSKFLGPDLRLAFVAADHATSARLAGRLGPGITWISHLLQRLAHQLLSDPAAIARIAQAREQYRRRNAAFVAALADRGIAAVADDGLNVWVDVEVEARSVSELLMRRGWLVRTGSEFALTSDPSSARHLRFTIHDLDAAATGDLVNDLVRAKATASRLVESHP